MDFSKEILILTLKLVITYNAVQLGWHVTVINNKQIELSKKVKDIKIFEDDINNLFPLLCGLRSNMRSDMILN